MYIDKWFVDDEKLSYMCRQILLKDDKHQPVRELAKVPLLLSLLCLVYEQKKRFPNKRYEIYQEATQALLRDWDAKRNISRSFQLSINDKMGLLAFIAFQTFKERKYFLREQKIIHLIETYLSRTDGLSILEELEATHGLFVKQANLIHSFSHLALQEYFVARYIVKNNENDFMPFFDNHLEDDHWEEVFLLAAGMLNDATLFIENFLQAIQKIISKDHKIVSILEWAEKKRLYFNVNYQEGTVRLFLLFCAFDRVLARKLDDVLELDLNFERALALDLVRTFAFFLDLNKAADFELDYNFDHILELNLTLIRNLDLDFSATLDFARDLDFAFILALDLSFAGSSDLELALEISSNVAKKFNISELVHC